MSIWFLSFQISFPLLDPHDLSSLAHLAPRRSAIQEGKNIMSIAHFGIHGIGLQSSWIFFRLQISQLLKVCVYLHWSTTNLYLSPHFKYNMIFHIFIYTVRYCWPKQPFSIKSKSFSFNFSYLPLLYFFLIRFGWLIDSTARYPMQSSWPGCCNTFGICGSSTPVAKNNTYNAWCYKE